MPLWFVHIAVTNGQQIAATVAENGARMRPKSNPRLKNSQRRATKKTSRYAGGL